VCRKGCCLSQRSLLGADRSRLHVQSALLTCVTNTHGGVKLMRLFSPEHLVPRFTAEEENEFRTFFEDEFALILKSTSSVAIPLSTVFEDHVYCVLCSLWALAFFLACHWYASLAQRRRLHELFPVINTVVHVATGRLHLFAQSQACAVFTVFVLHLQMLDSRKSLAILMFAGTSIIYTVPNMASEVALVILYGTTIGRITEHLVRLSFKYAKQTAELHAYMALQTAYGNHKHIGCPS
jgi:hypothetical protein